MEIHFEFQIATGKASFEMKRFYSLQGERREKSCLQKINLRPESQQENRIGNALHCRTKGHAPGIYNAKSWQVLSKSSEHSHNSPECSEVSKESGQSV